MKLKAVTLLDALMGLILSSIAVALAIAAYTIISKEYFKINQSNLLAVELIQFENTLNNDVFKAQFVKTTYHGFEIDLPPALGQEISNALYENQITYLFNSDYVLRKTNTRTDSFKLTVLKTNLQWAKESQNLNQGLIDQIILTTTSEGKPVNLTYHKKYDNALLMAVEKHEEDMNWGFNY